MEQPALRDELKAIPDYRAGRPAPEGAAKLSSNENPYPPLPGVLAAIVDGGATVNRYPDFSSSRLVGALANHLAIDRGCIAVGTGSVAVLAQVIQAVASAGSEVVVPWISFEAYPILVRLSGATLVEVALKSDYTHDLDAMLDAVTERTRLVMVCSPNNPTGRVVAQAEFVDFLNRVPSQVVVALDEAYVEFVDSEHLLPSRELLAEHPNLVVLRTFSKAYGLAGLRVGYAMASPSVAAALRKTQLPFGVSAVAEQAALASLASRAELQKRVEMIVGERGRVCGALAAQGIEFAPPQGNFVWLPLAGAAADFAEACEAVGVVVRAFNGAGVRVTIGAPSANDRFLQAAARFG